MMYDIYSKRTEHPKISQVEIPKTLRSQIFSILGEIVSSPEWKSLWHGFCVEKGIRLKEEVIDYKPQDLLDVDDIDNNDKAVIEENWLHCRNQIEEGTMENVFDLIDITFQFTYKKIQNRYVSGTDWWEKEVSYRQAVRDINIRFKEAKIGYQLIRNRVSPVDLNDKDTQQKTKQERIDSLVEWFFENYQNPVDLSPHFGREDVSRLIDERPYKAKDMLVGRFPEEPEEIIDVAVRKIESVGVILWYPTLKSKGLDNELTHNNDLKSVKAGINSLIANLPTSQISPTFDFGDDGLLHISSPPDIRDVANDDKLFQELRAVTDDLKQMLDGTNEYPSLLEAVVQYEKALLGEQISISSLYARGVRLENVIEATRKDIKSGEAPSFSGGMEGNINSLIELHGAYIMRQEEGKALVEAADAYRQSPQQTEKTRIAAKQLNNLIASDTNLLGKDVQKQIDDVTQDIGKGAHPERSNQVARTTFLNLAFGIFKGIVSNPAVRVMAGAALLESTSGASLVALGAEVINTAMLFLSNIIPLLKIIVAPVAGDASWVASLSDLMDRIKNLQNPRD